ncbi:MAG: GntR family transcriptional regulator [Phototrophicales bacterium]|nr:MAG: GntR family transcriptional regulator [Phototrophicales bacterium]
MLQADMPMEREQLKPIEVSKKTVAVMVQERIRQAILDGVLPAGSRIDQRRLATELQVSLVPVREALKVLSGEGFVQIVPRRGAFVTETSLEDMEDLYFARAIIEGQAAYHAAENLTDAHLHDLERLYNLMDKALRAHDYEVFSQHNRAFHLTIYDTAGSQYLSDMIHSLWELAERYRYRYLFLKDQAEEIQAEHRAILNACYARDRKQLRDAVIYHLNQTLIGVRAYITAEQQHKED